MKAKKKSAIEVQNSTPAIRAKRSYRPASPRLGKERVLIEFPSSLLQRADTAAAILQKNRSELIRTAVERLIDGMEKERFEQEMAEGYSANSALNHIILEEFTHVDREGF